MKCLSCGTELENGQVFCTKCGKEIQIVSDKNTLEEDVLLNLMNEEDDFMHEDESEVESEDEYEDEYEYEDETEEFHISGRRNGFFYFILIDAIAVCIVSVIVLLYYR